MKTESGKRFHAGERSNSSFAPDPYDFLCHFFVFYACGTTEMQLAPRPVLSQSLGFRLAMRFPHDGNFLHLVRDFFTQTTAPDVTTKEHFDGCGEWHRENGSKQAPDQQTPDKDRHDHCHRVKAHRIADDARCIKHPFKILDDDKNRGDDERMCPIPELKSSNEHGRNPTKYNPDVGDHR